MNDAINIGSEWGQRVRDKRAAAGLSQAQLATVCGVSQQAVSQIEAGKVVPSDRLKVALATGLETTLGDLFAWPEDAA